MENWDFKRQPGGKPGFSLNKREKDQANYRLLGQEAARVTAGKSKDSSSPEDEKFSSQNSRPNQYNTSIKMISPDSGPAPWEKGSTSYGYKKLPVVGEVAAGRYDVTVAYHEPGFGPDADYILVNPGEVKLGPNTFALRVRGTSMIENEIDNGDIIIVQAQNWADDGDFVIACLTDSTDPSGFVTLKRFYRHRLADRVVLQPANQSLNPIHILPLSGDQREDDCDGVKIQGKVTAIIKTGGIF